jgi:voltage-gated potassium channel
MILGYGIIAVPTGIVTAEMAFHTTEVHVNSQACRNCNFSAHADDALYCKKCGFALHDTLKQAETP